VASSKAGGSQEIKRRRVLAQPYWRPPPLKFTGFLPQACTDILQWLVSVWDYQCESATWLVPPTWERSSTKETIKKGKGMG
jgi:hypothetical protein